MELQPDFDLIVTIVNKGWSEAVIQASKAAGAEGGTVLLGRGTGIRETKTFFGISIEPEKEVVLTVICHDKSEKVLRAIVEGCKLEEPGAGIAFVVDLKSVAGIHHLCSISK